MVLAPYVTEELTNLLAWLSGELRRRIALNGSDRLATEIGPRLHQTERLLQVLAESKPAVNALKHK